MKGAFNLYVRAGEFDKAIKTLQTMQTAIPDISPQIVTNIIESALLGVAKNEDGVLFHKLLDESKVDIASRGASSVVVEERNSTAGIQTERFPLAQGIYLEMIKCPAGEFMMGYESWKTWRSSLNREQRKLHRVKLTKDFMLGKFPVTCSQWYAIMGNRKKAPKGLEDTPVGNITVPEMQAFCDKLTEQFKAQLGGKVFRLPTDAEWEYASKGGKNLDGMLGKTLGLKGNTGSSSRDSKEAEAIFRQMGYTAEDHARASDTNKPRFMWNTLPVGKHKPNH
jgi:formylglycine-generating enzyme required for sulfatase activity